VKWPCHDLPHHPFRRGQSVMRNTDLLHRYQNCQANQFLSLSRARIDRCGQRRLSDVQVLRSRAGEWQRARIPANSSRWQPSARRCDSSHGCDRVPCWPALYVIPALRGYLPVEKLYTCCELGGRLEGHTEMRCTSNLEVSGGSLGHELAEVEFDIPTL
jgi:hypothetical protein